jgi:hypothetical protein
MVTRYGRFQRIGLGESRMNMKLQLTETATNDRIEFRKLPAIIGRDSTANIPLDDPTLPPYQCMIGKGADDGAVVWNLRDDFPLYVNSRRVTKTELVPGDILTIGQNRFIFSCEAALHRPSIPILTRCPRVPTSVLESASRETG